LGRRRKQGCSDSREPNRPKIFFVLKHSTIIVVSLIRGFHDCCARKFPSLDLFGRSHWGSKGNGQGILGSRFPGFGIGQYQNLLGLVFGITRFRNIGSWALWPIRGWWVPLLIPGLALLDGLLFQVVEGPFFRLL